MAGPWERYQQNRAAPDAVGVLEPHTYVPAENAGRPWLKYGKSEQTEIPTTPGGLPERPRKTAFLNQGVAEGLGLPVDLMAGLMNSGIVGFNSLTGLELPTIDEPFFGSKNINRGLNAMGFEAASPDMPPETLVEHIFAGAGGAAGGLGPVGAVGSVAKGAATPVARAAGNALLQPYVQAPVRGLASEVAAGAGAGAGMDVAEEVAPDSPAVSALAALFGGAAGGAGPYAAWEGVKRSPVVGTALDAGSRFVAGEVAPFTEAGALQRARSRVAGLVEDPEEAIRALNTPTVGNLSPAVSTGERRLMALEQTVRDTDPVVDAVMRDRELSSGRALRDELTAPSRGVPASTARQHMENTVQQSTEGLNPLLNETFGEPHGVENVSKALRTESQPARRAAYEAAYELPIDYASAAGRSLEDLIGRVERTAPGAIALANRLMAGEGVQSRQILANIADDGTVSFSRMPETRQIDYITRALNQMAESGDGRGALGGQTDVGRVMGNLSRDIRGSLREANPLYREAVETAATPIQQRNALLFGQELLKPGTARDVVADRIADMPDPELAFLRQGVRSQLEETLANVRSAMTNPDVGVREAQQTLAQLSSRAVRDKLSMILPEDTAQAFFRQIDETRAMLNPRQSAALMFSKARPNEEIRSIIDAPNPPQAAAQLVAQAADDASGQTLFGLKGAFIDELMTRSRTGAFDDAGTPLLSGRAMQNALADNRVSAVAGRLLSPEERERFSTIADELARLETMRGRLPNVGNVMEGEPNSIVSMIARTIAARSGARAGQGVSGASLLTAGFASRRMQELLNRLTLDKAEGLIREAVAGDRELFELLLTPSNRVTPQQESKLAQVVSRTAAGTLGGLAATDDN
ncbi:hypothetical protein [Roseibium aggregatum]|uniref:hypothetical protein n=1 Tax=Roseibium aggregatum TaxID=187304 RepID=UPI001E457F12|nr:hypothetical protein [Roseibium aggregatum]UES46814.1 hypothetical protein GFK90_25255 [Roseibium aggregatum]